MDFATEQLRIYLVKTKHKSPGTHIDAVKVTGRPKQCKHVNVNFAFIADILCDI